MFAIDTKHTGYFDSQKELVKVEDGQLFWALFDELMDDKSSFLNNRASIVEAFKTGNMFGLSVEDKPFPFPCFFICDCNAIVILWVHTRARKKGLATTMLELSDIKNVYCPVQSTVDKSFYTNRGKHIVSTLECKQSHEQYLLLSKYKRKLVFNIDNDAPDEFKEQWFVLKHICEGGESNQQKQFVEKWCQLPYLHRTEGGIGGDNNVKNKQMRFRQNYNCKEEDDKIVIEQINDSWDSSDKWTEKQINDIMHAFIEAANCFVHAKCVRGHLELHA